MQTRKLTAVLALVVLLVSASSVFAEGTCADCHNDSTIITGKATAIAESMHATGDAYKRGTSGSCAGCHSGGAFSAVIAAGLTVDNATGDPTPTRQDCRACHQIHVTGTGADWALETEAPVTLMASGAEFDGGMGNLCANCHQSRRGIADPDADGMINVSSSHWGPHHGPQTDMLLGVGGAGVEGEASLHASFVADTCVTCHLGDNMNHNFEPDDSACVGCHEDADGFDINGVQTQVAALVAEVEELLLAKGLLSEDEEGGVHPVVGLYPADQAAALWNYIFIVPEDGSMGVHNAAYTIALLEAAKVALQ